MAQESRNFDASNKASAFVENQMCIDAHIYAGKIGWPDDELFSAYHNRARDAGINVASLSMANHHMSLDDALAVRREFLKHIESDHHKFAIVQNTNEIESAASEGRTAFFFCAQGASLLDGNPEKNTPQVKALGLGMMSVVYNGSHRGGDGCLVDDPGPITEYGKLVVDHIHRNKIILDMSHASEPTALSAIEYSQSIFPEKPVVYSHSSPISLCNNHRNISDDEIRACAETGGVICLNTCPWFLVDPMAMETRPEDIVNGIDFIRDLVGIDHVGLASDDVYSNQALWAGVKKTVGALLSGPPITKEEKQYALTLKAAENMPSGSAEAAKIYAAVADEMWTRGYDDKAVAKVLGGNMFRVMETVWC